MTELTALVDKDSNGNIERDELRDSALEHLGILLSDAELAVVMSALDTDGDGTVSLAEFSSLVDKASHAASGRAPSLLEMDEMRVQAAVNMEPSGLVGAGQQVRTLVRRQRAYLAVLGENQLLTDRRTQPNVKVDRSQINVEGLQTKTDRSGHAAARLSADDLEPVDDISSRNTEPHCPREPVQTLLAEPSQRKSSER